MKEKCISRRKEKSRKFNIAALNSFILLGILCFMIIATSVFLVEFIKDNRYSDIPPQYDPIDWQEELDPKRQFNINGYDSYVIQSGYFYSVINHFDGLLEFGKDAVRDINISGEPLVEIGDMLKSGDSITATDIAESDCLILDVHTNTVTVKYFSELYVNVSMHYSDLSKLTSSDEFKIFYKGEEATIARFHSADYLNAAGQMVPVKLKVDNSPVIFINEISVLVVKGEKDISKSYFIKSDFLAVNNQFGVIDKNFEFKYISDGEIKSCRVTINRYMYDRAEISKIESDEPFFIPDQILKESTVLYYKKDQQ